MAYYDHIWTCGGQMSKEMIFVGDLQLEKLQRRSVKKIRVCV